MSAKLYKNAKAFSLLGIAMVAFGNPANGYSGDAYTICNIRDQQTKEIGLYAFPSVETEKLMPLDMGAVVEARGDIQDQWLEVVVEIALGKTYLRNLPSGFVQTEYLCPIK